MVLTLASGGYTVYFLFINAKAAIESVPTPVVQDVVLPPQVELNNLPSLDHVVSVVQRRDIFSSTNAVPTSTGTAINQTPTGQLPANLKVVGIIIAHPSQIIIEDTSAKQTYFINQDKPQAGISILRVEKNAIILNYNGQAIPVPINNQTAPDNAQTL